MLSYIEISKEKLLHNYQIFRGFIHPKAKIVSVVKGNAYGHGLKEVVKILDSVTDYFAVNSILEIQTLRNVSQKPTFIMGYISKEDLRAAVQLNGIIAVYDRDRIAVLNQIGKSLNTKVRVNIKIDAALGRQGLLIDELEKYLVYIKQFLHIEIDGIYGHFANIEDTSDFSHAQKQIDIFAQAVNIMKKAGYSRVNTHLSSTAGTLVYEQNHLHNSVVRIGIGLYGMWPSDDLRVRFESQKIILKPVLRWVTHIAQVKTVPENYSIGYGLTYVTTKATKIAIIPQGYSDGYDRGLSNIGYVLIQSTKCRVLGRVAMNMFVVDVSHLSDISAEEEVVLLGSQGTETITAEQIGAQIGTINYEVTTRLSPLIPHIVI